VISLLFPKADMHLLIDRLVDSGTSVIVIAHHQAV
jgi:hypothetical protein